MHRLLLIKVTEIVEVIETITILVEDDALKVKSASDCDASSVDDIFTEVPALDWLQPELNEMLLNVSIADVITPVLDVLENPDEEE